MKAVICSKYGEPEVLKIQEVPKPKFGSHEVLIKIMATAVNSADVKIRGLRVGVLLKPLMRIVLGFKKPRRPILGAVYSGVVTEVGKRVTQFKPGDKVFGSTGFQMGAYAEYLTTKENGTVYFMPKNASFEEAAAIIFGGQTAIFFLEKTLIWQNYSPEVLIIGSTGSVGLAAIQVAQHYNAKLTAVCSSSSEALLSKLKVENMIFYDESDFIKQSKSYDIIFDTIGCTKRKSCRHLVKPGGKFISVDGLSFAIETKNQLKSIKTLFEKGWMKATIDRTYSLDDIQLAHAYVDTGRKKGNVVIRVSQ